PRRALESIHHRLRIEEHQAQRLLARSEAGDSRPGLQRSRAAGLSRARVLDERQKAEGKRQNASCGHARCERVVYFQSAGAATSGATTAAAAADVPDEGRDRA